MLGSPLRAGRSPAHTSATVQLWVRLRGVLIMDRCARRPKVSRRPHSCPVLGRVVLVSRGHGFPCIGPHSANVCPLDACTFRPTVGDGDVGGGAIIDQVSTMSTPPRAWLSTTPRGGASKETGRVAGCKRSEPATTPPLRWLTVDVLDDRHPVA